MRDFIDKGYLPDALVNFIAFLGWNPGDEREIFSMEELINEFNFDNVSKAAAVFNNERLDWMNGQYIKYMDSKELTKLCIPFLQNASLLGVDFDTEWIEKVVEMEKERMHKLIDLPEAVAFVFSDKLDYDSEILIWKKSTRKETKQNLEELSNFLQKLSEEDWQITTLEQKIGEYVAENSLSNGEVLWPMRVALSGQKNSPSPFEIGAVLGKSKSLDRITKAIEGLN